MNLLAITERRVSQTKFNRGASTKLSNRWVAGSTPRHQFMGALGFPPRFPSHLRANFYSEGQNEFDSSDFLRLLRVTFEIEEKYPFILFKGIYRFPN